MSSPFPGLLSSLPVPGSRRRWLGRRSLGWRLRHCVIDRLPGPHVSGTRSPGHPGSGTWLWVRPLSGRVGSQGSLPAVGLKEWSAGCRRGSGAGPERVCPCAAPVAVVPRAPSLRFRHQWCAHALGGAHWPQTPKTEP